jgi:hypothetical protein
VLKASSVLDDKSVRVEPRKNKPESRASYFGKGVDRVIGYLFLDLGFIIMV